MKVQNLLKYFNERYPPQFIFLLSFGLSCLGLGLASETTGAEFSVLQIILVAFVFAAFLLRLRAIDEFKDKAHDSINYPHRPLQRHLITQRQLVGLLIIGVIIELTCVFALGGWRSLALYSLVIVYSLLTAFEFFIGSFLKKHFTLYFLSHESIFIFFMIWIAGLFNRPINTLMLVGIIVCFTLLMTSFELVRKFEIRLNPEKKVVEDTYLAVWGRPVTLIVICSVIAIPAVLMSAIYNNLVFVVFAVAPLIASLLIRNNDLVLRATFILIFLGISIGAAIL